MKARVYVVAASIWMILCHYATVGWLYSRPSDEQSAFDRFFAWTGGTVVVLYLPVTVTLVSIAVAHWIKASGESSRQIRSSIALGLMMLSSTLLAFWAIVITAGGSICADMPLPPSTATIHRVYLLSIFDVAMLCIVALKLSRTRR